MTDTRFEDIVINDVDLRINSNDITHHQTRNVQSYTGARDDAGMTAINPFYLNSYYSVAMTFDVTDNTDLHNLTKLCVELDYYPFLFIVSEKLESFAAHMLKDTGGYHIYGVRQYRISQDASDQNIILLELELLYFNYIPFSPGWSWKKYVKNNSISRPFTPSTQSATTRSEASIRTSSHPFRGYKKEQAKGPTDITREETEVSIFVDYFENEIAHRKDKIETFVRSRGKNFLTIQYPNISDNKADLPNFDKLLDSQRAFSHQVTSPVGVSDGDNPLPSYATIYTTWETIEDPITKQPVNLNGSIRAMADISITRTNNFAVKQLVGYDEPVLQYMGKGYSTCSLSLSADSGLSFENAPDQDANYNPIRYVKFALNKIKANQVKYREWQALNILKIESYLTQFIPSYGFVVAEEGLNTNAYDQGIDIYSYLFLESNPVKLLERQRYEDAGNTNPDYNIDREIEVIFDTIENLGGIQRRSNYLLNTTRTTEEKDGITSENQHRLATNQALETLTNSMRKVYAKWYDKEVRYQGKNINATSRRNARRRNSDSKISGQAVAERKSLEDLLNLRLGNIRDDQGIYTIDAEYRMTEREKLQFDRDINIAFTRLYVLRAAGSPFSIKADAYVKDIEKNYESIIEDFQDQAIPDLEFAKRLKLQDAEGKYKYSSYSADGKTLSVIDDYRELNPFFFVVQDLYVDGKNLYDGYSNANSATALTDEAFKRMEEITIAKGGLLSDIPKASTIQPDKAPLFYSGNEEEDKKLNQLKLDKDDLEVLNLYKGLPRPTSIGNVELPTDIESENSTYKEFLNLDIDPYDEADQALFQTRRMGEFFEHGLNNAFPTAKVYIVEGDEANMFSRIISRKHHYYEVKGILNLDLITNSDENPVDVLQLEIINPNNAYTDDHVMYSINHDIKDFELLNTIAENQFTHSRLRLKVGNKLHVKMGFGNDINKLDTVFNGVVSMMEDNGTTLSLIAEGFGRELVQQEHGDDPGEDLFFMSAKTNQVISHLLYYPEIEHFGNVRISIANAGEDPEARRISWLAGSSFGWIKSRLNTNIYVDKIMELDENFGTSINPLGIFGIVNNGLTFFSGKEIIYDFPIYKSTPWTNLKEMEYRHPGALSKPVIYGDRMSYFFGIKEQLYIHQDLAHLIQSNFLFDQESELYKRLRFLRFRPVCDFHILSTDHNIISNRLRLSSDFGTVMSLQHYEEQSDIKNGDFSILEMKVDDNLIPSDHRKVYFGEKHGTESMLGCNGEYMGFKYGTTYLRKELETMYDGTITLLGNPKIKAGDYASLHDDVRGLTGIIKIREASHSYSVEDGYTTTIVPGLYVEASQFNYSNLWARLFALSYQTMAQTKILAQQAYQSSDEFKTLNFIQNILQSNDFSDETEHNGIAPVAIANAALAFAGFTSQYKSMMNARSGNAIANGGRYVSNGVDYTLRLLGGVDPGDTRWQHFLKQSKSLGGTVTASNGIFKNIFTTRVLAATPQSTLGALLPKSVQNSKTLKFLGFGARAGIAGGRLAASTFWLGGPIGWTAALAIMYGTSYLEKKELTRQPFRLHPLQMNNKPFIGGIAGYEENGYFESLGSEISKTWEETRYLTRLIGNAISR